MPKPIAYRPKSKLLLWKKPRFKLNRTTSCSRKVQIRIVVLNNLKKKRFHHIFRINCQNRLSLILCDFSKDNFVHIKNSSKSIKHRNTVNKCAVLCFLDCVLCSCFLFDVLPRFVRWLTYFSWRSVVAKN